MNSTTVKILEAVRAEGDRGAAVKDVKKATSLGDTTIRKGLDELVTGGFLRKDKPGATMLFFDVRKDDDTGEEVKDMPNDLTEKAEAAAAPTQNRGKPRDEKTIARDAKVLEAIKASPDGLSVDAVAEATDTQRSLAYIAIYRLRRDGKIESARNGTRTPVYKAVG
jgi:hypothetical protein